MVELLPRALLALALFVGPAAAGTWALGRRWPAPAAVRALDFGTLLSADLLLTLTLAWALPLGRAVWLTRALYAAALLAWAAVERRALAAWRPRWNLPLAASVLAVFAVAVKSTWRLSYELVIWDRDWHIGIASMLRAARLPFENFYLPRAWLRYHFLGDVIASNLQTLSGDRLNAAYAFSVAHDLFLSLTGVALVALVAAAGAPVWGWTRRALTARALAWWLLAPALTLAVVFAGPMTLKNLPWSEVFTSTDSAKLCGRTFLGYTTLAFRPHVVAAGYFIAQALLAVVIRTTSATRPLYATRTTLSLLTSAAALALLDEASAALLPVGVGAAWLLVPGATHPSRWKGLAVVLAMAALLPATSAFFGASLAPGGPAQRTEVVPLRHLQLFDPVVAFTDRAAWFEVFWVDYFPLYSVVALVGLVALWERRRDLAAVWCLYAALSIAAFVAATKIEVNAQPSEGHRFLTAAMVLSPLVAAWAIAASRKAHPLRLALLGVLALTAASGYAWERAFLEERFGGGRTPRERSWAGPVDLFSVDCASWTGPPRPGRAPLEYVDPEAAMPYAGCRPVRLAGRPGGWSITVIGPAHDSAARRQFECSDRVDPPTAVVCMSDNPWRGECRWARRELQCAPVADGHVLRCPLPRERVADFYDHLR